MAKLKEPKWNKQGTKAAQKAWQEKLRKNTGAEVDGNDFLISDINLKLALGPYWYQVLKKAEEVGAVNVLAITAKSIRKTAIVKFIQHYLLAKHEWVHCMDLRRTKELSSDSLMKSHVEAIGNWAREYNTPWLGEVLQQSSDGLYFIRDNKRKDNQKIEFSSFDAMRKLGGFVKPYVFHWEELVDPDSKGSAPDKDDFLYVYKLIRDKNRENFLAKGQMDIYNTVPTNWFTMNRWDEDHPLIEFAEEHVAWEPIKEWMINDPEENCFFMHYVDKPNPGWEALDKTLIVHGSKLSNHILIQDEEWKQEQLDLIASGDPKQLGTVLGDVYEGSNSNVHAYHYTREDKVTREEFLEHYAKHVNKVYIAVDLDFSRQIRFRAKYAAEKHISSSAKMHRFIRDRAYAIKCDGLTKDGARTEYYFRQTKQKLLTMCDKIRAEMPHIKKVYILMDDKKAQWVGRFNFTDAKNPFWVANKIDFDQKWPIKNRPKVLDEAQDTGFLIDIEHHTNEKLHHWLKKSIIDDSKKHKKQRLEKDKDKMVDDVNADEYPLYLERGNMIMNNHATRILGVGEQNDDTWRTS